MLTYQIYDSTTDEVIGHITGQQLRDFAGVSRHTPIFNDTLVEQINSAKEKSGEPERIRLA